MEEEKYKLTEWGCLYLVLNDYNIDVSHITAKMGEHMINDLFELLAKCGYLEKKEEE